jgi:predicted GH43/DUF377 family glycosyl hydrolase
MKKYLVILFTCFLTALLLAEEVHVSKAGNDTNIGTLESPLLTIQAAARMAHPGDTITVHEGVYREQINPVRGGESEKRRIVYRAAPGEKVEIKGSEMIASWVRFSGTVWKATIPNGLFGNYHPYKDLIRGDWFVDKGRIHHTGEVYLNGKSLWEMELLEKVLDPKSVADSWDPMGSTYTWYCESDAENTYIYANFQGTDPNEELVEINVRPSCFYPDSTGINFISVQGFYMSQAATQWAPPTAEQIGLIGTNWSKGWIIEDNVIRNSKCAGITLGKYGDEFDNTSANSAEGYIETVRRALNQGWDKANIGSHMIRNNTIYECGQVGICGSLGGVFSTIENNNIYNIWTKRLFTGPETAGIKIHASIDMLIKGNRVVNTGRGIWLDWMAQGARVSSNLCYQNDLQDFYAEVNHGPYLVDNNLFLSLCSVWDMSQGGAYVHNLMAGKLNMSPHSRVTPFQESHSTQIAGYHELLAGDYRFINNLFVRGCNVNKGQADPEFEIRKQYGLEEFGLSAFNGSTLPARAEGNVYLNGASTFKDEVNPLELAYNPGVQLEETDEGIFLSLTMAKDISGMKNQLVTTELLGSATISGQSFVNPDDSPVSIHTDFLGNLRKRRNPSPGPFKLSSSGRLRFKVSELSSAIAMETVKKWSEPYRNWYHYPDHVIPARPNIAGFEDINKTDVPTVFQLEGENRWYMSFIGFDGKGYQSFIAQSEDLLHWENMQLAMGYGPEGEFDFGGVVLGAYLYEDYNIRAPRTLKKKEGKYFSLYGAYPRQGGYELRPGYEGLASSVDGLHWQRAREEPILSVFDKEVGTWEKDCIYQPWLLEHKGSYYNLYNAANGSIEQLGVALSDNLYDWKRYAQNPVIPTGPEGSYNEVFSSDIKVFWDRDHWTGFFFGVGRGGAHIMMAFSTDLLHWTVDPEPIYKSGGNPSGLDSEYAHKISLVWNPGNETYYMFYNAVGGKGRGIGLITSKAIDQ